MRNVRRTRIDPTETSTEALSVRLSANTARALAYLLDGDERSKSDVVQGAIVAAAQAKRGERLRRESARLMADPEEVARMESMAADMEAIGVDLDELERAEGRRVDVDRDKVKAAYGADPRASKATPRVDA